MGFFSSVNRAEIFSPGSLKRAEIQPTPKLSVCNRKLYFLSILSEGEAKILNVISSFIIIPLLFVH